MIQQETRLHAQGARAKRACSLSSRRSAVKADARKEHL